MDIDDITTTTSSVLKPDVPVPAIVAAYRRPSEAMISEGPPTPPQSPGNSTQGVDTDAQDIYVDEERRYSGRPREQVQPAQTNSQSPPSSNERIQQWRAAQTSEGSSAMDVEALSGPPALAPVPPSRLLEDEQVHMERKGTLTLRDFEIKGTLGTGTFGRVLLVRLRSASQRPNSQNYFAMKVLPKTEIVRLRQVEHVNAERYILSRVRHPFVVDLFATFQDSLNIYMLLSYVPGGELFTHLRRAQRFTPDVTRFYLATIVLALKYLHSFNIIYRDLKPENLLLDARGYLRLTDFGFAKIVDDRTWTLCGTPEYLAPEIIQSDGHGKAADWWACGILAYEMMVGYPPFFDENAYGIYEKILRGHIHWPRDMDRLSRDLIRAFLNPDRSRRLGNMTGGPQDVLDHPWFRGVDWDALEKCEIHAPIIPHTTAADDMRHFLRQPLPPMEEIPGFEREERQESITQRFDPIAYQFLEF